MGTSAVSGDQGASSGTQTLTVDQILANPDAARRTEFVHHAEDAAGSGGTVDSPTTDGVVHRFDPSAGVSGASGAATSGNAGEGPTTGATTNAGTSQGAQAAGSGASASSGPSGQATSQAGAQSQGGASPETPASASSAGGSTPARVQSVTVTLQDGTTQTLTQRG